MYRRFRGRVFISAANSVGYGTNPEYTAGAVLLGDAFPRLVLIGKDGLSYGVLGGYNYQVGQVVLGVEGDFAGWTVGKIRYTAITGDFLTAHSKWGGSVRGRLVSPPIAPCFT